MSNRADRFEPAGTPAPGPMSDDERAVWERQKAEAAHNAEVIGRLRTKYTAALNLICDLTDRDDCWLDHHGGCQAHGYLSLEPGEMCPHQEAKDLLEAEGVQV